LFGEFAEIVQQGRKRNTTRLIEQIPHPAPPV
jgi:hypothetical protein